MKNIYQTKLEAARDIQTLSNVALSIIMMMIGQRKLRWTLERPQIEYFEVCTSEFHFGDWILKESETNTTDNWTGRDPVWEQCFNRQVDRLPGGATTTFLIFFSTNLKAWYRDEGSKKHNLLFFTIWISRCFRLLSFFNLSNTTKAELHYRLDIFL